MAGLSPANSAYYNMASNLILDNQILQKVPIGDVLPYLRQHKIVDDKTASSIDDGATERIRRERCLQAVKRRQLQGYIVLKMALSTKGDRYRSIMDQIDDMVMPSTNQVQYRLQDDELTYGHSQPAPSYGYGQPAPMGPSFSRSQYHPPPQQSTHSSSYSYNSYYLEESEDL